MTDFKVGDVVTPTQDSVAYLKALGGGADNEFVVLGVSRDVLTVRPAHPSGRASINAFSWRFDKVESEPKRVEGQEIKPEDIRVGDEIIVTIDEGVRKTSRQGVVDRISSVKSSTGEFGCAFSTKHLYLNWLQEGETFVLVKAAPEIDELLEKLKNAPGGQVIRFRGFIAHKSLVIPDWNVFRSNGFKVHTSEEVRRMIGDAKVTFYKEED